MTHYSCDVCGKAVDSGKSIYLGYGGVFRTKQICEKCGASILKFMKKHGLLPKE